MNLEALSLLVHPERRCAFEFNPIRVFHDDAMEGYLVCSETRDPWPVFGGVAVVPPDLRSYLKRHANVIQRMPIADPRIGRMVLSVEGHGFDRVNFDDVIAQYCDLAVDPPNGYHTDLLQELADLSSLLRSVFPFDSSATLALDVGCGVGRSAFVLRTASERVLGVDYGLAVVRRARNIAVSVEDFFLPGPRTGERTESGRERRGPEVRVDLGCLVRSSVDFVAAQGESLPFQDACFDCAVVHAGDHRGVWKDPEAVVAEAKRVLSEQGALIVHDSLCPDESVLNASGPWRLLGAAR